MKKLLLALSIAILANQTATKAGFVARFMRPTAAKTAVQAAKQPSKLAAYTVPVAKATAKSALSLYLIGCAFATHYEMKEKELNYKNMQTKENIAINPVAQAASTYMITALHTTPAYAAVSFTNQLIELDKALYNTVQEKQKMQAIKQAQNEAAKAEQTQRHHQAQAAKAAQEKAAAQQAVIKAEGKRLKLVR